MKTHEKLVCLNTGKEFTDNGLILDNPDSDCPSFLRAQYFAKKLAVHDDLPGLYRFSDWLPIRRTLNGSSAPVTYKSEGLAKQLQLKNLYITFSGYWPERGVQMTTGTFKECEAFSVCARLPENYDKVLVVASAGNTARAFTRVCSENKIPLVVVVPEEYLFNMWFENEIDPCVKLIAAGGNSDYFDTIHLSNLITQIDGFFPEGGAKNVARRDGMGTTVLSAVTTIGAIPDYYFQAVGSGTGAIAAWEANLRFNESGEYEPKKMKLMVSQNAPFLLIHDSWKAGERQLTDLPLDIAEKQVQEINAKVLSNRKPPYPPVGGLFDALKDTGGDVIAVNNDEAESARLLFNQLEGNDITPAAGVAVGSLIKKVRENAIDRDAIIMLNITGGGIERFKRERKTIQLEPALVIPKSDFELQKIEDRIKDLF